MRFLRVVLPLVGLCALADVPRGHAYPLDGYDDTGIIRLEAYRIAQKNSAGKVLPFGAMLSTRSIDISLADYPEFVLPAPDVGFSARLREALGGEDAAAWSVAVLDLTDPTDPVYAAHREARTMNPGSVGKVLIALGLFQALADAYPDDLGARQRILYDTMVEADAFIQHDHHEVPFWHPGWAEIEHRPIALGDTANLWTWLDWMLSPSSNAAGSVVLEQAMLLAEFGRNYPVPARRAAAWFRERPKRQLSRDLSRILQGSVRRSGLDPGVLRQGAFFTREGKRRVPGGKSWASSRAWMDFLVAMEKGALVDAWSSAQLKRLLYLTQKRIRYASAPALDDSAVFYKSGSLYKCRAEKSFVCAEYAGNVWNFMNSIAVVESVRRSPKLRYLVVVNSNVLRKNAVEAHRALAARIHQVMEERHPPSVVAVPVVD
jgi:hypothetical protein